MKKKIAPSHVFRKCYGLRSRRIGAIKSSVVKTALSKDSKVTTSYSRTSLFLGIVLQRTVLSLSCITITQTLVVVGSVPLMSVITRLDRIVLYNESSGVRVIHLKLKFVAKRL